MTIATPSTPYPGIHRLQLPLVDSPLKYVSAYLLPSPDGHLLIDTGWKTPDSRASLLQQLDVLGVRPAQITRVLITHGHIDHYGLAAAVLDQSDAQLIMHALEEKLIALRYGDTHQYLQQTHALLKSAGAPQWLIADAGQLVDRFAHLVGHATPHIRLQGGESLRHGNFTLEVIWTPGHSPGHICLYEPTHKLFFSGDHVLPGITPNIGLYPQSGSNPLGDYIASLKQVRDLDVQLMLPAHGPLVTGYRRRVNQILVHHERRTGEMLRLLVAQPAPVTAYDLAQILPWSAKRRPIAFQALRGFDQRLAVSEVSAHLVALAHEGRVIRHTTRGVHTFRLAAIRTLS
ncbi:MAG: MBL fold metallo-hydrolase [Desulfatitalea sp.]|nr:MBL fold metallo-hydrolase [Desulfatitalea sp.]